MVESTKKLFMPPKLVTVNYFCLRAVLVVSKIWESKNLNGKTHITEYQCISEIGPNGLKLIYKIQNT